MCEWISVNDKLPEEDEYILVWRDLPVDVIARYSPVLVCYYWHGKFTKNGLDHTPDITHWMPLLDPPNTLHDFYSTSTR